MPADTSPLRQACSGGEADPDYHTAMSPASARRPALIALRRLCGSLSLSLLLGLGLHGPAAAQSGSDEQFVAARDAFRAGDLNRLDRLAEI